MFIYIEEALAEIRNMRRPSGEAMQKLKAKKLATYCRTEDLYTLANEARRLGHAILCDELVNALAAAYAKQNNQGELFGFGR